MLFRSGKVKTRLARTVGDTEALRIYRLLLARTQVAALQIKVRRFVFYSDFIEQDSWLSKFFGKYVQQGADLGERMENAFETAFKSGATKALIIGSDCPELTGEILKQAFDALDHRDFVIGPVPDGGYYLLGMKQLEPSLFYDIAWSTETVRSTTVERIRVLRKTYALLPVLSDVDTEEDWNRVVGGLVVGSSAVGWLAVG